jgi:antitoxin (DNA-binding transcriptional repressor) of toxin-antitoxin stability system
MQSIGVRELRQNASAWLTRVEAGESFAVTNHGRTVAMLTPPPRSPDSALRRLRAEGRVVGPTGDLRELLRRRPRVPASRSTADVLDELRADRSDRLG